VLNIFRPGTVVVQRSGRDIRRGVHSWPKIRGCAVGCQPVCTRPIHRRADDNSDIELLLARANNTAASIFTSDCCSSQGPVSTVGPEAGASRSGISGFLPLTFGLRRFRFSSRFPAAISSQGFGRRFLFVGLLSVVSRWLFSRWPAFSSVFRFSLDVSDWLFQIPSSSRVLSEFQNAGLICLWDLHLWVSSASGFFSFGSSALGSQLWVLQRLHQPTLSRCTHLHIRLHRWRRVGRARGWRRFESVSPFRCRFGNSTSQSIPPRLTVPGTSGRMTRPSRTASNLLRRFSWREIHHPGRCGTGAKILLVTRKSEQPPQPV